MKKQCPKCKNTYTNATLTYCLEDGARLVPIEEAGDAPTVSYSSAAYTPKTPQKSSVMKYLTIFGIVAVLLAISATVLSIVFLRRAALGRENANVEYDTDRRPPPASKDAGNTPSSQSSHNSSIKDCSLPEADNAEISRITFAPASFNLTPASADIVKNIAEHLKGLPDNCAVEIGSYTDNIGDVTANIKLSAGRAEAVKDNLVELGISADKLTAKGYGPLQPKAENTTEEGRRQNRRIEFKLTANDNSGPDASDVLNLNDAKTLADLQSQGIEKVSPAALPKLNPLILIIEIKANGDLSLNKEGQGNISGNAKLAERLRGVFSEREKVGVYREGTNIIEKAVIIEAPSQINRGIFDKTVKLVKDSGANPISIHTK